MKLFTDGAARGNPGEAGAGFLLIDDNDQVVFEGKKYLGSKTNNEAEYIALILGLEKAVELKAKTVDCYLDSMLVVKQLQGEWKIKKEHLRILLLKARQIAENFTKITYQHIYREKNKQADKLANLAIDEK